MGLVMFVATVTVGDTIVPSPVDAKEPVPETQVVATVSEEDVAVEHKTTKERVEEYFSDIPILAEVASCESHFRQFNKDGSVLRGVQNSQDVGVMQINEKYHLKTADKLGYNLYSLEGNMAYARYLYEKEGTRPWNYSSKCWGKSREIALN
jgi:hypothetical protein